MTLLNVRLRPTRFAFLVPPGDMNSVQRVFEMNTCLWGGQFNPIIPFVTKRPAWWDRHPSSETAEQIINGYLDYFEPDILVVTNEEQATRGKRKAAFTLSWSARAMCGRITSISSRT